MIKLNIFSILFSLLSLSLFGKSFTELSSNNAVKVSYSAVEEGYKNIHLLAVNKNELADSVPMALRITIGKEVLTDYIVLGDALNKDVKTVYLYEGDSMSVELQVLSNDNVTLDNIKGNLKVSDPMVIKNDASPNSKGFIGNYWDAKKPMMFRLQKQDSIATVSRFTVAFAQNFPYDKFFYQINVIAPDSSFYSVEGEVKVNKGEVLTFKEAEIDLTQEVGVTKTGKYILEIVPLMGIQRINGIKSVGYQLINIKD